MNRMSHLIIGIFAAFAISWLGVIVVPYMQIGRLSPQVDEDKGEILPPVPSGLALAGEKVYAANGCFYCHTQQVRPRDLATDVDRAWGARRTVARDYIRQNRVFLGSQRTGQDLASVATRRDKAAWYYAHLYNPQTEAPYTTMPAYRHLFTLRKITGQKSASAIELPEADAPPAGYEVVPTDEAQALVAYLLSLDRSYLLNEALEKKQP